MKNEDKDKQPFKILEYLGGIETSGAGDGHVGNSEILEYLGGIETLYTLFLLNGSFS